MYVCARVFRIQGSLSYIYTLASGWNRIVGGKRVVKYNVYNIK